LTVKFESASVLAVTEAIERPTDSGRCALADQAMQRGRGVRIACALAASRVPLLAELDATSIAEVSLVVGTVG
jgi:hypothetical protein